MQEVMIVGLVFVVALWDLGRRFSARGQQVTREEFSLLDGRLSKVSEIQRLHDDTVMDHTKVLANHAAQLQKQAQTLTQLGIGRAFTKKG